MVTVSSEIEKTEASLLAFLDDVIRNPSPPSSPRTGESIPGKVRDHDTGGSPPRRRAQSGGESGVKSVAPAVPDPAGSGDDYSALFECALSAQKKGDYAAAIARYAEAIELDPHVAEVYINRGAAYESTGELDLALRDLDAALDIESRSDAYHNRGNVHFKKGDYGRAIRDYGEALKLDPGNADAHLYRGHALRNLAFYDKAIRDFEAALALDSRNANAYVDIGITLHLKGDDDGAIGHYDRASEIDSDDPYIYLNRGASHYAGGHNDRAEADFGKALAVDPDYAYAYAARSLVFARKGDGDRALRDLDRAVELEPRYANVRGSLYLREGELDRAIRDFDTALALDPNDTNVWNDRGVAYELKGDSSRAMEDYERALSIRPNRAAYANRGVALLRLSEWDRARPDLRSARNMGMDLVSIFRDDQGGIDAFERRHDVKLPQDIADMVSVEEEPAADAGLSVLEMFREARESIPETEPDDFPSDGARNYKHYLYGWPRE